MDIITYPLPCSSGLVEYPAKRIHLLPCSVVLWDFAHIPLWCLYPYLWGNFLVGHNFVGNCGLYLNPVGNCLCNNHLVVYKTGTVSAVVPSMNHPEFPLFDNLLFVVVYHTASHLHNTFDHYLTYHSTGLTGSSLVACIPASHLQSEVEAGEEGEEVGVDVHYMIVCWYSTVLYALC